VWECPDLFELPVDGKPGQTRWVLVVNLNPGGVAGGSGAQYFLGSFDGARFTPEGGTTEPRWIDYGSDFYAVASWGNVPGKDGRRLWIGWMNNWDYGQDIPTAPWRSAQSLPREVRLKAYDDGIRLVQVPVPELTRLRSPVSSLENIPIKAGVVPLADRAISGDALEVVAVFEPGAATELGLSVRRGPGQETLIGYDVPGAQAFVDRRASGPAAFSPKFAARHAGPLPLEEGRVTLHVFVDRSSVELFANGGRTAITDQVFPGPASDGVALYAKGGPAKLVSLQAWRLRSIWR